MKSILMSTHKKWIKAKQDGIKLYEIRKSAPPAPFKVYEYETLKYGGCGKIVQEWICDEITLVKEVLDFNKYKTEYLLHITALKIYDKPRELSEFYKMYDKKYSEYCKIYSNGECTNNCKKCGTKITRPPQSWQYVETPDWAKEE